MMTKLENKLNTILACDEAIEWASTQKGSFQKSWDKCPRGDWLLWLLVRSKSDNKKIVLASCKIARIVLEYIPKGEERPLVAIQTAEAWVRGEATLEEVKKAVYVVHATSNAANASAAYAARAAANAAYNAADAAAAAAAYSAADANAANDANAASAAAAAAYCSTSIATRKKSLLNSAKIVREFFPKPPLF